MTSKENEQCEFVSKTSNHKLYRYIQNGYLQPDAEVAMLKRGNDNISLFYVNLYGLSEPALDYVFTTGNKKLIFTVIEKFKCSFNLVKKLISSSKYEIVKEFFNTHNVVDYPEVFELNKNFGNVDIVLCKMRNDELSPVAVMMAIMSKQKRVISYLCLNAATCPFGQTGYVRGGKAYLSRAQIEALARVAMKDDMEKLMSTYNSSTYKFLREIYMFRFGEVDDVKTYLSCHSSFTKEGKSAFFDCATVELIAFYCQRHNVEDWDAEVLKNSEVNDCLSLLDNNWISAKAEQVLIDRNNEDEISCYIEKHYLWHEEVMFIRKCSHSLVMKYIMKHNLCDKAQIELLKRGNIIEIFAYVFRHNLCSEAEFVLSKLENELLYEAWLSRW